MTSLLNLSLGLLLSLNVAAGRIGKPPLEVGAPAPQFALEDIDGTVQDLNALLQKGPVVLVFFPQAKSPICTQQLQNFVARAADIKAHGATVLAVSTDKADMLRAFREDLKANFAFISDNKALLAARYQARTIILPKTQRRTYIIGHDQHVAFAAEDDDATNLTGVIETLEALQTH